MNAYGEKIDCLEIEVKKLAEKTCDIAGLKDDMRIAKDSLKKQDTTLLNINSFVSNINNQLDFMINSLKGVVLEVSEIRNLPLKYIENVDGAIDKKIKDVFKGYAFQFGLWLICGTVGGGILGFIGTITGILKYFKL